MTLPEDTSMNALKQAEQKSADLGWKAAGLVGTYLGAAFGFVTGLAWNNAVQALINYYIPDKGNSVAIQFVYAIGLTFAVALGTYVALRVTRRRA